MIHAVAIGEHKHIKVYIDFLALPTFGKFINFVFWL